MWCSAETSAGRIVRRSFGGGVEQLRRGAENRSARVLIITKHRCQGRENFIVHSPKNFRRFSLTKRVKVKSRSKSAARGARLRCTLIRGVLDHDGSISGVCLITTVLFRRRHNENSERALLDMTLTHSEWSRSPTRTRSKTRLNPTKTFSETVLRAAQPNLHSGRLRLLLQVAARPATSQAGRDAKQTRARCASSRPPRPARGFQ